MNQTNEKFLGFNRVLCLSPHPDDVEYCMAATIMKYGGTHFDLLTMSEGGDFDGSTVDIRHQEVRNVWDKTGISNYSLFVTSQLKPKNNSQDQLIFKIERDFLKNYHNAIFIPAALDSHFEHQIVSKLGPALARDKLISIIEYKTSSTLSGWSPNTWVNVDGFIERKLELLKEFISQQDHWYFKEEALRNFHMDFQSCKKDPHYVEQYKIKQLYRK